MPFQLLRSLGHNNKPQKITFPQHRSDQLLAVNLILGYTSENKTQKQKRPIVSYKMWSVRTTYFHLKKKLHSKKVFPGDVERTVDVDSKWFTFFFKIFSH